MVTPKETSALRHRPGSLFQVVRPYLCLANICGFLPSAIDSHATNWVGQHLQHNATRHVKTKSSWTRRIYCLVLCIAYMAIAVWLYIIPLFIPWVSRLITASVATVVPMRQWATLIQATIGMTSVVPLSLIALANWNSLANVFVNFSKIDVTSESDLKAVCNGRRWVVSWKAISEALLMVLAVVCLVYSYGVSAFSAQAIRMTTVVTVTYLVSWAGDAIFLGLNTAAKRGIEVLVNDRIRRTDEQLSHRDVDQAMKIHSQLCEAIASTGRSFAAWIFLTSVYSFMALLLGVFIVITTFSPDPTSKGKRDFTSLLIWVPLTVAPIVRIFFLSRSATEVENAARDTSIALASLAPAASDKEGDFELLMDMKITRFQSQLANAEVEFSIFGYFSLSNGLFLALIGNFVSYLVVLLEFSKNNG